MLPHAHKRTRVLIVGESSLVRRTLAEAFARDSGLHVVGHAPDPTAALDMIRRLDPHVLTLDMAAAPRDGLGFLQDLMHQSPLPVVMIAPVTDADAEAMLDAFDSGAVDVVEKPDRENAIPFEAHARELIAKIHSAAHARPRRRRASRPALVTAGRDYDADRLIAIGASAGGVQAIRCVLERMPANAPAILVTQHLPPMVSRAFADRMDRCCAVAVCEAQDGQRIVPGHCYIAPGGRHLTVETRGTQRHCRLSDDPPEHRRRPAIDVMFRSVARHVGPRAIGAILTGTGEDGARGLLQMCDAGAATIAQNDVNCVAWEMPRSAVRFGAVREILPLEEIGPRLLDMCRPDCA